MTYELRLERHYEAPLEVVFDTFVDPSTQGWLHGSDRPGWKVQRSDTDVRVGGTSTYAMGTEGQPPDIETRVYSVIDRPHRLVFRHSMEVAEWGGRTVETEMTITFEARDGTTLLTMLQTGFEREEDRDAFMGGWPAYLDTLGRVVASRVPDGLGEEPATPESKARQDG
ncbi:MAG: SRPBCC domain-containing protein [Actinomycetota bacterium]|nr:SRPBCC domain-containing protein [Actinomycetota bacterium]